MSTKTLRKRIALVAVSALGAGLLSVVAVPSANATGAITNLTGSVGLLAGPSAGTTTRTAVLLSTGTLAVNATAATTDEAYAVVSAGAVIVSVKSGATTAFDTTPVRTEVNTISADQSEAISSLFTIKPTGVIGSTFTVSIYDNYSDTTVDEVLTVTIAGSSVQGTAVAANSYINWTSAVSGAPATTETASNAATTVGLPLFLYIQLRDAYKANVTSATGALIVEATAGAKIGIGGAGTTTIAVTNASPAALYVQVNEATVGAGWSGTLKVTYNGVVITTKAGRITGSPAKITLTPKGIGSSVTGTGVEAFSFTMTDATGNALDSTSYPLALSTSSNSSVVSAMSTSTAATAGSLYVGKGDIVCVGLSSGSSDVVAQTTLSNGTIVKSSSVKLSCALNPLTYTASFDKASYKQGEIAKLTIKFKDAIGNPANSVGAISVAATISHPMLTAVGLVTTAIPASTRADANGQLVVTFSVGTTGTFADGSYNAIVDLTDALTNADVQTVAYSVSTGTTGVTNADVLKAIVSLIASINKQIAALQKALLKK
jgi:hypothetical protein